ncbi:MAG TPA: reverse transcriptase-like protein [Solirubrobacterales bacterium]|nr:reverse transcriptase-like protein [Solirubrobacterales bacterium]
MRKLTVNVDGGARGNPGPAAIGVVVRGEGGEVLEERGERIGTATNNVAEYKALLLGIERAAARGADELELVGDSELIVKQVRGEYKVKDATLRELHAEAKRALGDFERWSIRHVRRAENAEADRLVNQVLDGEEVGGAVEPGSGATDDTAPEPSGQSRDQPIDPGVDIGHVHLKVADLDRALDFYCGVLGFELQQRLGDEAAFVSAGGYHHHIGLNTWQSRGGSPPPPGSTGLFHTAIRYPTRRALAAALRRLGDAGIRLTGASDHGVSEALYLDDPDGNGVELYWDRPKDEWPRQPDGQGVAMFTAPLDLQGLLDELDG